MTCSPPIVFASVVCFAPQLSNASSANIAVAGMTGRCRFGSF